MTTTHNVAAGTNDAGHVAICICGWRRTSPDLDTIALAIGNHIVEPDSDTIGPVQARVLREAAAVFVEGEATRQPHDTDEQSVIAGLTALIRAGWQIIPPS